MVNSDGQYSAQWMGLHEEVTALDRQCNIIKLVTVTFAAFILADRMQDLIDFFVLSCWFIESCVRVYQSRAMSRLEALEERDGPLDVYRFYAKHVTLKTTLQEYFAAATSPTVALYYLGLLVLILAIVQ